MSTFWQTVIPPALAALIAGRIAWTRTSRLLRTINTNLDLLDRLPADHPKRAMLEDRNGELLDLLVRRQQRRFGPFTEAVDSSGSPDSYRARARASASVSISSVIGGAYPEALTRCSGTGRTLGPVDPVALERPETAPSNVGMVWHPEPMF
jgi:hypothetical protein